MLLGFSPEAELKQGVAACISVHTTNQRKEPLALLSLHTTMPLNCR